jgi:hypothetical protein
VTVHPLRVFLAFSKKLARGLTIMVSLLLIRFNHPFVHTFNIDPIFIRYLWEGVEHLLSLLIFLFVPEDQIDPVVEHHRYLARLQELSHLGYE